MAVYKVPARAGDLKKNRFEFSLPGSNEILSLPRVEFMTVEGEEFIEEFGNDPKMPRRKYFLGLMTAVDPVVGEKVAAARLERKIFIDLAEAWITGSAVDTGKS